MNPLFSGVMAWAMEAILGEAKGWLDIYWVKICGDSKTFSNTVSPIFVIILSCFFYYKIYLDLHFFLQNTSCPWICVWTILHFLGYSISSNFSSYQVLFQCSAISNHLSQFTNLIIYLSFWNQNSVPFRLNDTQDCSWPICNAHHPWILWIPFPLQTYLIIKSATTSKI